MLGVYSCFFLPQVAADVEATVQEVEAALQLLQEKVSYFILKSSLPWTDTVEKTNMMIVYSCIAL